MSKPVIAIVAIAAIAAGGYYVAWNKYADEIKNELVQSAANVNQKFKPLLKDGEFLHYDSVEKSGFPFAVTLTIINPVVKAPVDALMRLIPADKAGNNKMPANFSWIEELAFGRNFAFTTDLIGSKMTVAISGDILQKTTVNGKLLHSTTSTPERPTTCNIVTNPSGFLKTGPAIKDAETFLQVFHGIDCSIAPSTVKDTNSGAALATMTGGSVAITNNANNGNRVASLKEQVTNMEYQAGMDTIINDYMHAIAEATGGNMAKTMPYSVTELGKSDIAIDIAYNGPEKEASYSDKNLKAALDINAFNYTSNLFTTANSFHFAIAPEADKRKIALSLHTKNTVSERYDQIIALQTKQAIEEMAKTEGKTGKELEAAQEMAKMGSAEALVNAVLPRFHPFGDMSLDIDANLEGPFEQSAFIMQGHHVLKDLNILTTPYGLKASGETIGASGKSPSGSLLLTCLNCDALIDDAGNYITRFTNYIDTVRPDKTTAHPTQALYNGVKTFLHSVALNGSDTNAKDLNFNAIMKDNGEFTISGKQVMEVMQSYMTNVSANMPVPPATLAPDQTMPPLAAPQAPDQAAPVLPAPPHP